MIPMNDPVENQIYRKPRASGDDPSGWVVAEGEGS